MISEINLLKNKKIIIAGLISYKTKQQDVLFEIEKQIENINVELLT